MQAAKDHVVRFHYRVSELGGDVLESSFEQSEPLAVLLGHGGIIAGVEAALLGRAAGESFSVDVAPEQGYGEHRVDFRQRVAKKYFPTVHALKPGMQVMLNTQQGPRPVTVLKIGLSVVDVDLNHPMAGKHLRFEIEVVEVRPASEEELAHGHVHGAGGHQH